MGHAAVDFGTDWTSPTLIGWRSGWRFFWTDVDAVTPAAQSRPRWSADGTELYYVTSQGVAMAAQVRFGPPFRALSAPAPQVTIVTNGQTTLGP